jgi:hypothetical protein
MTNPSATLGFKFHVLRGTAGALNLQHPEMQSRSLVYQG